MLGRSIYLNSTKHLNNSLDRICKDDFCFLSLHMPEDLSSNYVEKCNCFLNQVYAKSNKIIADVSRRTLSYLHISSLIELAKDKRIYALRFDDGFSKEEIAEVAPYCKICINASVVDKNLIDYLLSKNVDFFAMHNFYPREETALDEAICLKLNEFFHSKNIFVCAFISSDAFFRGPIYKGLPTVEKYRFMPPYVQHLLLKNLLKVDEVFIGDPLITPFQEQLIINYENTGVIEIACECKRGFENFLFDKVFTIRQDSNSISARLLESRNYASNNLISVEPFNTISRSKGSITIDNNLYLRYAGEMIIVLKDLPENKKVNVIANIKNEYLPLLDIIKPLSKIKFIKID